ncbi:MAG: cytochrome c [Planctomycetales bacterium]|nr:cytochrome c [Planctomycetales bacterium]
MRYRWILTATVLLAVIGVGSVALQVHSQEAPRVRSGAFMRLKMEPAKNVLEGIALGNFQMIRQNAEEIRKLTLDEGWMVKQTQQYRAESEKFQKAMLLLSRAAKEEDLDACVLAYMQVTMNCVRCHELLRDAKL